MACRTYLWAPERKAEVEAALRASRTRAEAARALGVSTGSLDHACVAYGFSAGAMLARKPRPPKVDEGERNVKVTDPEPAPLIEWTGARPQTTGTGLERRINIGDLHIPAHSPRALACVYAIVRLIQPHKVYQLGDLFNAQAFSHHGPTSPKSERVDLATLAARSFVRSIKRAAPGAELIIVKGNHDGWSERWEAENPAFEGSFDFEKMLGLRNDPDDDRPPMFEGVKVVRHSEKSGYVDGPIAYCHGTGGGLYAARRYAENVGPRAGVRHVRFAHHHTDQVYVHKNGIAASCVGWLGNEDHPSNAFRYAPPPRGWWVGITIDDVYGDHVTSMHVPIENGAAAVLGKLVAA